MGKLLVLNVVVVILAVYASAKYTYQNEDNGQVDGEIDAIARALDALEIEDRGQDAEEEEEDEDIRDFNEECECDEDCSCNSDECERECEDQEGFDRRDNEVGTPQKKIWGAVRRGLRNVGRRIRRGIRRVRFRRRVRFPFGKK